ncbi:MAG: hypothetical protein IJ218_06365 [Alphaproteobacteria bacterium]|nr:hypothetical protein [Alphaproteobacteria bacterium]
MEAPKTVLEKFSPLLLLEYIRLMTVAMYLKTEGKIDCAKFKICAADYEKLMQEPLQTALIGVETNFKNDILSVKPTQQCLEQYNSPVMNDSVMLYYQNYGKRYQNYISLLEES